MPDGRVRISKRQHSKNPSCLPSVVLVGGSGEEVSGLSSHIFGSMSLTEHHLNATAYLSIAVDIKALSYHNFRCLHCKFFFFADSPFLSSFLVASTSPKYLRKTIDTISIKSIQISTSN